MLLISMSWLETKVSRDSEKRVRIYLLSLHMLQNILSEFGERRLSFGLFHQILLKRTTVGAFL